MAHSNPHPHPECSLPMHQVLFTTLVEKPQNLLPTRLNLKAPIFFLGQELEWLHPSPGHPECGSGTPVFAGTRCPEHTGHTSEGEYLFWILHLFTAPECVASEQG